MPQGKHELLHSALSIYLPTASARSEEHRSAGTAAASEQARTGHCPSKNAQERTEGEKGKRTSNSWWPGIAQNRRSTHRRQPDQRLRSPARVCTRTNEGRGCPSTERDGQLLHDLEGTGHHKDLPDAQLWCMPV